MKYTCTNKQTCNNDTLAVLKIINLCDRSDKNIKYFPINVPHALLRD